MFNLKTAYLSEESDFATTLYKHYQQNEKKQELSMCTSLTPEVIVWWLHVAVYTSNNFTSSLSILSKLTGCQGMLLCLFSLVTVNYNLSPSELKFLSFAELKQAKVPC